jgi:hypothetical protein
MITILYLFIDDDHFFIDDQFVLGTGANWEFANL